MLANMDIDEFGVVYFDTNEVAKLLYKNPELDISKFKVNDPEKYNNSVKTNYADMPLLEKYTKLDVLTVEEFDARNQNTWYMPDEYKRLDIAEHVLSLCKTDAELQRVGAELLLFQERNLFDLLCFLKYFVDTMRKNNVVWGVGRGSSVASYVLYLLGVHRINSIYYDLDVTEFLK
jgi:DNA polymerase III alpha subunit